MEHAQRIGSMRRPEDHAAPVQDVGLLGLAEDHWDLLRRDVAHLAQKPRRGARHDPEVGGRAGGDFPLAGGLGQVDLGCRGCNARFHRIDTPNCLECPQFFLPLNIAGSCPLHHSVLCRWNALGGL